ncbi:guanylate-binding protein 4-like [Apodemus sylvaticus]|uniref:guanylate-binding protein 4-like n=1 Tax=Apodemus sylvaticus TaxID=10129 RepID=UPI002243DF4C|nr:guanylate-binding protein 4-like [Apodemus sylvaticus]XP_052035019.1 guanylate-binding protein 4-like [Apodemus sylvaticus]XP_052035020.1 guanylate-binding protein 4-like [Apodemus sylvaticus]XP_052035021.1 guanylate-binding protein 4-like [Apodemus sylvaticus]
MQTYLDAIGSGTVPFLENAVTTLAQLKNPAGVQKAADHYSEKMAQRMRLPTHMLQELPDVPVVYEKISIAVFTEHSFKYEQMEFQKLLLASKTFQNFLTSQITGDEFIWQSDKALTESQKAIAAEKAKKEAVEKELELSRQQRKETEEKMEALKKSMSEAMAQMQAMIQMERENHMRDQQCVQQFMMKVLDKVLDREVEKQSDKWKNEMNRREREIQAMKQNSASRFFDGVLDIFREVFKVLYSEIKKPQWKL